MKKKIFALAVIVIYLSLAVWHTFAYYTTEGTAHNIITSGGVDIALEEWQATDGGLIPYPDEPIYILPGVEVSKIVTVKSLDESVWVRLKYDYLVISAAGEDITDTREVLDELIIIAPNDTDYVYHGGWWYYKKPLNNGEVTSPLFTKVEFSAKKLGNKYEGATLSVIMSVSAVQVANNGETVLDAAGWAE